MGLPRITNHVVDEPHIAAIGPRLDEQLFQGRDLEVPLVAEREQQHKPHFVIRPYGRVLDQRLDGVEVLGLALFGSNVLLDAGDVHQFLLLA